MISVKKWVWASFSGWFIGILLIIVLSSVLDSVGIEGVQFYIGFGVGTGIAIMQWRALLGIIPNASKWIWYTILGVGSPFLVFDIIKKLGGFALDDYNILVCVSIGGLLTGLLQSSILKTHYKTANRWIFASLLGWVLSAITVLGIEVTRHITQNNLALFVINLILIISGGAVLGLITAPFLRKIISKNQRH
jgi:hypothetical protein